MSVNLSKNGSVLMQAYKEVVDGRLDTNWALFTYEGNSNDIRLAETGDGGLEEMVEELSSGKVMYGFCRVQDPNSGLPKYVLINWTGEGVKDSRKGICANHVSTMANFLKGAHVTINARSEDDVEPDSILQKVSKASGASFNFHRTRPESRDVPRDVPRGSVGSVYKRVNAVEEIQQTKKEDFWSQAQREEERRRWEESQRVEQQRQEEEQQRREVEEEQQRKRERRDQERAQQIEQDRLYQKKREEEEREKEAREMEEKQERERERRAKEREQQAERDRLQREQEEREQQQRRHNQQENGSSRTGINSAASVQKANEAKSLISQRTFNPRDIFQQREQSAESRGRVPAPAPSRPGKLQSPFLSQKPSEREASPTPAAIPSYSMHLSPVSPVSPVSPEPAPAGGGTYSLTPLSPVSPISPVVSQSPAPAEVPSYSMHRLSPISPVSPVSPEPSHSPAAAASPVQPADTALTEEEWSDEFDDDDAAEPEDLYQAPQAVGPEEDLYENIDQVSTAEDGHSLRARALYDYQAADDSEITFDPGDIITEIDMVDEGWWRGYGPDGHYGMFPANYVELL